MVAVIGADRAKCDRIWSNVGDVDDVVVEEIGVEVLKETIVGVQ